MVVVVSSIDPSRNIDSSSQVCIVRFQNLTKALAR